MDHRGVVTSYPSSKSGSAGSALTFYLLVLLAMTTFAPCALLPAWRDYQATDAALQVEQHRLEALEAEVQRQRRLVQGICGDPAVVVRLAQRDLGYERANTTAIPVAAPQVVPAQSPSFAPEPPAMPRPLAWAARVLPPLNYDRVFCDEEVRTVVMAMSVSLIVLAFALFGRQTAPTSTPPARY